MDGAVVQSCLTDPLNYLSFFDVTLVDCCIHILEDVTRVIFWHVPFVGRSVSSFISSIYYYLLLWNILKHFDINVLIPRLIPLNIRDRYLLSVCQRQGVRNKFIVTSESAVSQKWLMNRNIKNKKVKMLPWWVAWWDFSEKKSLTRFCFFFRILYLKPWLWQRFVTCPQSG